MIKDRINAFVLHVQQISDDAAKDSQFKSLFEANYISEKWCRIVKQYTGSQSVYAFIALQTYSTKTLGTVQVGDIHRPASWKIPAKHARGNVFQEDFNNCAGPYGVIYLR